MSLLIPPPPSEYAARVPRVAECSNLIEVGVDIRGRKMLLEPRAAEAWSLMKSAAATDGFELLLVSSFRSVEYQASIVLKKLEKGQSLDEILKVSAYPGFSEHHSGRAVDICSREHPLLEPTFDQTPEFRWLASKAADFGFRMSYPPNNPFGIAYEPWHWCWQEEARRQQ